MTTSRSNPQGEEPKDSGDGAEEAPAGSRHEETWAVVSHHRADQITRPSQAEDLTSGIEPGAAVTAKRIGRFELVRELGRGGQAQVFLARDTQLDRAVALKIIDVAATGQVELIKRFQREAAIVSRLDDPGICSVYDADMADGMAYIAMQFISGEPLSRWLKLHGHQGDGTSSETAVAGPATASSGTARGSVTEREQLERILGIVESVARSLQAAHEAGVIHRDIKPANIMITERARPIIVDFGLARANEMNFETLTVSGDLFGTPLYMSPEQVNGRPLDERSDVYSLGVVLFESLTGRRPFEAPTREGLYRAILTESAVDVRRLRPDLPRDLSVVVATALEKDLRRRYQSARDLADDLGRIRRREVIRARPVPAWVHFVRLCQRNPLGASLAAMLVVVLMTALVMTLASNRDLRREREASAAATYRAQIAAAHSAIQGGDTLGAQVMLEQTEPERRGWEWRHLNARRAENLHAILDEKGNPLGFYSMSFSRPERDEIWVGGADEPLTLISAESGRELKRLEFDHPYREFAVSPDGRRMLIGHNYPHSDSPARLWMLDLESGGEVWSLSDPDLFLNGGGSFAPDGSSVVVKTRGGLKILDAASGEELNSFSVQGLSDHSHRSFGFLDDSRLVGLRHRSTIQTSVDVVCCDLEGQIVWSVEDVGTVASLRVAPGRDRVLIAADDKAWESRAGGTSEGLLLVSIHDARDGRRLAGRFPMSGNVDFLGHHQLVSAVAGALQIHDARNGGLISRQLGPCRAGDAVHSLAGGDRVLTGSSMGPSLIWAGAATSRPWIASVRSDYRQVEIHAASGVVASAGWGMVTFSSLEDGRLLREACFGSRSPGCMAFSPDGKKIAVGDTHGGLHVIDVTSGEVIAGTAFPEPPEGSQPDVNCVRALVWSADGERLYAAISDRLMTWTPTTGPDAGLRQMLGAGDLSLDEAHTINAMLLDSDGKSLTLGLGPSNTASAAERGESATSPGALVSISLDTERLVASRKMPFTVTAFLRARLPVRHDEEPMDVILAGDADGAVTILHPNDLDLAGAIAGSGPAILDLDWHADLGRLIVVTQDRLALLEMPLGREVMATRIPTIQGARFVAATRAIWFAQSTRDRPFGLLELETPLETTRRRLQSALCFAQFESARNVDGTRAGAVKSLEGLEFEPPLRAALRAYAETTIDNPARLSSQAWLVGQDERSSREDLETALRQIDIAIAGLPGLEDFRRTRSLILLGLGRHQDCIDYIKSHPAPSEYLRRYDLAMLVTALCGLDRRDEAARIAADLPSEVPADPRQAELRRVLKQARAALADRDD